MHRTKLPINEIVVEDRQRLDMGDIPELAESLKRFGLIQPVVITQDKRLLAGGRRLTAAVSLGWQEIDVVYRETLTADEAFEIELEENVRRKEMSWQERCLNIAKIHSLKRLRSAEEGKKWGLEETGALLGASKTNVHYCLTLAKELQRDPQSPLWQEPTMKSAWDLVLRHEKEALEERLRQSHVDMATAELPTDGADLLSYLDNTPDEPDPAAVDLERERAKERYLANRLNDPAKFDEYYEAKKIRDRENRLVVPLSGRLLHTDCITYMRESPGMFDHIITDIPYGIDPDMMEDMKDFDTVRAEHEVRDNLKLMADFFPAAYTALKPDSYLVTWCDLTGDPDLNIKFVGVRTLWEYMVLCAKAAGFAVQRWPLTWNKTHRCGNKAANKNFTKSTENALVCRKGNAVLMHPAGVSCITASNEEIRREIDHPFAKPFECWEFIAKHVSFEGQLILEPFAGRGSGVISMLRMRRNVIGLEVNQAHYNVLLENVRNYYRKINPDFRFV